MLSCSSKSELKNELIIVMSGMGRVFVNGGEHYKVQDSERDYS